MQALSPLWIPALVSRLSSILVQTLPYLHVQDRDGALEGRLALGHRRLIGDGHHLGGQQGPTCPKLMALEARRAPV